MASKTAATRIKRKNRDKKKGAARKSALQLKGTTLPKVVLFGDEA
jgi:hypothetical protein